MRSLLVVLFVLGLGQRVVAEGECGLDQRGVREGLGEVAQEDAGEWVHLLAEESQR